MREKLVLHYIDEIENLIKFKRVESSSFELESQLEGVAQESDKRLFRAIDRLITKLWQANNFLEGLSQGDLNREVPSDNLIISPFKQLHANLSHLVWQVERLSHGDYNQKIDFLGDFSLHFNRLIDFLKEKRRVEEQLKINEEKYRQLAESLTRLNEDKNRFLKVIAHDLRSPFTTLLGFTDILLTNFRDWDESVIEEQLLILNETARNTYNLLSDLLLWSISQSGTLPFNPTEISLKGVVEELLAEKKSQLENKEIECDISKLGEYKLLADENMVKTVIRNLLSNAIKFSYPGGRVEIKSEERAPFVEIVIVDFGVGIAEEKLEKLFDFASSYSTRGTNNEEGTGLGLSLSKDFLERHGAKIWIESVVGEGSQVHFTLPILNS